MVLVTIGDTALRHDGCVAPTVLDRKLYDEALAAEVLGVPRPTLHYWLEGGTAWPDLCPDLAPDGHWLACRDLGGVRRGSLPA